MSSYIRTVVQEEIRAELEPVKIDMKGIKKMLDKVSKGVDTLIPYFDKRITSLEMDMKALKQN